jgi:hypothetical protein
MVIAEARVAACALIAAGEVFRPLLWSYRHYGDAVFEIAALSDQADGQRLQQLADQLLAMFYVVNEALMTRTTTALQEQAERLGITVDGVDARLYPQLPDDDADPAQRRTYELSISGQADRWKRLGFAQLGQSRGHAFYELIRVVWLLARTRGEIDRFLERLEALAAGSPKGPTASAAAKEQP